MILKKLEPKRIKNYKIYKVSKKKLNFWTIKNILFILKMDYLRQVFLPVLIIQKIKKIILSHKIIFNKINQLTV